VETQKLPRLTRGQQNGGADPAADTLVRREPLGPDDFKQIIRSMGVKVTAQRLAILEALAAGPAHVTAQAVFENVVRRHADIGFATVYRFLRKMTELGFVTEVRMGGLPARYELTPRRHHDHLTCTRCSRIVEFENSQIESLQERVARENGFLLTHHVLELYGLCRRCQNQ
jgi:Fur family transcriptional regulator, ferric uptake regulator